MVFFRKLFYDSFMNKTLLLISFLLLNGCARCSQNSLNVNQKPAEPIKAIKSTEGKLHYKFQKLEDGVLAKSGSFTLFEKDILDDKYLSELESQKAQLGKEKSKEPTQILKKGFLESEIYRRKLLLIDKKIKNLALAKEAENLSLNIQDYVSQYIFEKAKQEATTEEVQKYLKERSVPEGKDPKAWAIEEVLKKNKEKSINYILERYILELPILVNLVPPQFPMDIKYDWVPHWGPENAQVQVMVFSDTWSDSGQKIIKEVQSLKKKYKNLFVGFRPLFSIKNPFQKLSVLTGACVWAENPESYWEYLISSLGDHKERTENVLYSVADKLKLKTMEIRQCVFQQRYNNVVEYHAQFNEYLGIQAGPVVYVSGELFSGAIKIEDLEKAIDRKLSLPTAGVW